MGRALLVGLAVAVLVAGGASARGTKGPPPAPTVGPIVADFRQQDFATYDSIAVTPVAGRNVRVSWWLHPPKVDPGCDKFRQSASDPDSAVWNHGDADGCDHSKMTAVGHDGYVYVALSDGQWLCTAVYHGTNSGTGTPAVCHSALREAALNAITTAEFAELDARAGKEPDQKIAQSKTDLTRAIAKLDAYGTPAAGQAATALRRAVVLDKLARELPAQRKGELTKALALKDKAWHVVLGLP